MLTSSLKRPWTPHGVASLALGLVAASAFVVLSDLSGVFLGWGQLVVIPIVTAVFGGAQRFAFTRAMGKSGVVAVFWSLGTSVLACGTCFGLLGGLIAILDRHDSLGSELAFIVVIGIIVGVLLGALLVPFFVALRAASSRALVDVLDRVLFAGAALVSASAGVALLEQTERLARRGSFVILGAGTVMFVLVGVKTWIRARWLHAVLRGEVPTWAVIDSFEGDVQLPAIGVRLREPAVLATGNFSGGPFRAAGAVSPVARVDRKGGYFALSYISFACALLTLAVLPISTSRHRLLAEHRPFDFDELDDASDARHFQLGSPTKDIAVGDGAVCVQLEPGSVGRGVGEFDCWGSDAGWLVPGGWTSIRTPTAAFNLRGTQLHLERDQACTLQGDAVHCERSRDLPDIDVPRSHVRAMAAGDNFQLYLNDDSTVTRYGHDPSMDWSEIRPLGPSTYELPPAKAIGARARQACILLADGAVYCVGQGSNGDKLQTLHQIHDLPNTDRIVVRDSDAWARTTDADGKHRWFAWGTEGAAALQPAWDDFEELAGDGTSLCGLRADGSVACATGNSAIRVTKELTDIVIQPRNVLPPGSAVQIAASWRIVCARGKTDAWCWDAL